MTATILAALGLNDPDSLKRAIATGLGGVASVAVAFVSPWLAAHGLPAPSPEVQLMVIGAISAKVAVYVYQSGQNSIADKQKALLGAVPAPAGAVNPADVLDRMAAKPA